MKQTNPPKRITSTVLNALKGGVVPRVGLEYITVGRDREIDALLRDIDIIADGGAAFRFIVGKYGSGKSFLLQTIRNYATERGFVVVDADLSPERRFVGAKGPRACHLQRINEKYVHQNQAGWRRAAADSGALDFRHPIRSCR